MGKHDSDAYNLWLIRKNRKKRSQRLAAAKRLGRHTKDDWLALKEMFGGRCVRCIALGNSSGLLNVDKDHIMPLYLGGSDGIDNLQPLCALCNASKSGDSVDYRPVAATVLKLFWPGR
jgi:5-methylcytosine-specific restriction endonuclease McrA